MPTDDTDEGHRLLQKMASNEEDYDKRADAPELFDISSEAPRQESFMSRFFGRGDAEKKTTISQDFNIQTRPTDSEAAVNEDATQYRTYKRRWFGLLQLTLMNIVVSWDVSSVTFFDPPSLLRNSDS